MIIEASKYAVKALIFPKDNACISTPIIKRGSRKGEYFSNSSIPDFSLGWLEKKYRFGSTEYDMFLRYFPRDILQFL